jgi:hypothetical protein
LLKGQDRRDRGGSGRGVGSSSSHLIEPDRDGTRGRTSRWNRSGNIGFRRSHGLRHLKEKKRQTRRKGKGDEREKGRREKHITPKPPKPNKQKERRIEAR